MGVNFSFAPSSEATAVPREADTASAIGADRGAARLGVSTVGVSSSFASLLLIPAASEETPAWIAFVATEGAVEERAGGDGSFVKPEETAAVTALRGDARTTSMFRERASMASTSLDEGAAPLITTPSWEASGLMEGEDAAERVGVDAGDDTAEFKLEPRGGAVLRGRRR